MLKIFISDRVSNDVTTVLAPNVRSTAGRAKPVSRGIKSELTS